GPLAIVCQNRIHILESSSKIKPDVPYTTLCS
ncbi:hypothetical protein RSAG8_13844, partial [Rhizoctonia solani AG-8 WAC10335]